MKQHRCRECGNKLDRLAVEAGFHLCFRCYSDAVVTSLKFKEQMREHLFDQEQNR